MSAPNSSLNRLPYSIRKHITGENFQRFLPVLFFIGGSAIPASVVLIVAILKQGHATIFPPDDPHVSWVKGPETRGTFNIIWVCATTIFTCVYVSVHVDVPDHEGKEDVTGDGVGGSTPRKEVSTLGRWLQDIRAWLWHKIKPNLRKAYWVFFNIFAPELMVLVSFCERESAKSGVEFMYKECGQTNWKLRHAFFADMGGFKLPKRAGGREFRTGRSFYEWFKFEENCPPLDYKEVERDIKDRSKKDIVLKIFTCVQAAWFIIETLERFAQHQPVSALEVTTCSYIICAIITQICWLRKPYGVNRSHSVHIEGEDLKDTKSRPTTMLSAPSATTKFDTSIQAVPELGVESEKHPVDKSAPGSAEQGEANESEDELRKRLPRLLFEKAPCTPFNRAYIKPRQSMLHSCLCACFVGVIVGFIHIIPFWNTRFVNTEGQWMWRTCCGVQISVFLAFAFGAAIEPWYHGVILWISLLFLCLFYCMSRIVLFALIWTSFSSQPVGLYQNVHWGFGLFPHLD